MINYTPHTVTVRDSAGKDFVFPASGIVPRVEMSSTPSKPVIDGCPTILVEYGVAVLPKDHPRQCIVSTMFADVYRRTHDTNEVELFVPDSGPTAIRENGQIVAVRALIRR